jgi:hypothetical protein
MDDEAKASLFNRLVNYVINSSSAMDDTAKILALDPSQSSQVSRLNKQIDSAKSIMTKVNPSIH